MLEQVAEAFLLQFVLSPETESETMSQSIYIKLREGQSVKQRELDEHKVVIADYDAAGLLLGIEVLDPLAVTVDGDDAIKAIEDRGWLQHDRS
jgi:hypothetical protein